MVVRIVMDTGSQGLDQHSDAHTRAPHTPEASGETKRPSPDVGAC